MTHDELIAVVTAHKNREPLQFRNKSNPWRDVLNGETLDDMLHCIVNEGQHYRVKPKPSEKWINDFGKGMSYAYSNPEEARLRAEKGLPAERVAVHYREVIE